MIRRLVRWLALLVAATILLLTIAAFMLADANNYGDVSYLAAVAPGGIVGGLIGWRRPGNLVGWCILGNAFCFTLGEWTRQYAIYGLVTRPGSLPFALTLASPSYWIWFPGIIFLFVLLPLYFPNGRLVSPRWRGVAWSAVVIGLILTGLAMVRPGSDETMGIPNPLGVESFWLIDQLQGFVPFLWLALGVVAAISLVVRFRTAQNDERQQIKWVMFAVVLLITTAIAERIMFATLGYNVGAMSLVLALSTLWVAIAVAILKYRLYDIDLLINRTLVYGTLTGLLAAIYLGSVVMLEQLINPLLGGNNQIVIVASTLAIAALFQPLRRRVQRVIDRRFYRRSYNAQQTLHAFATRLREETDLEHLADDVVHVVQETLQPAHVTLWLCEEKREA